MQAVLPAPLHHVLPRPLRFALFANACLLAAVAGALGLALWLGGPRQLPPAPVLDAPFAGIDWSGMPQPRTVVARDGARLAYRSYPAEGMAAGREVVLVHGSSGSSRDMHVLARALARAGHTVHVPDLRGHGASGERGYISYVGQLEDDLEDLLRALRPAKPPTLVGFSAAGGFALRVAGGARQDLFANYLLLAPLLGPAARHWPTAQGASVGMARLVALGMLNQIGVHAFDRLPVARFASGPRFGQFRTPEYSYALAIALDQGRDLHDAMRAARKPMAVVVGAEDESFMPDGGDQDLHAAGRQLPVTVVPELGHQPLTLEPRGVDAVVRALQRLNASAR